MPEGDSLRRMARRIAPILVGETVTDIWFRALRGHRPRVGFGIHRVEGVGKYLLIEFDRGLVLYTHLGMSGSWRTSPLSQRVPSDPRLRVSIETKKGRAMCFAAPRIFTRVEGVDPSPIAHLGPDLSNDEADIAVVVARARDLCAGKTLAEMLLDQRVAAGVGNVFKSEALFVAGMHPFKLVDEQSDEQLAKLWTVAHEQLVANRNNESRNTTRRRGERTHVYRRGRKPCRRCHDSINYSAAGVRTERSTYWCPRCQPR